MLDQIPRPVQEMYAYFNVFRCLGFSANDIFFNANGRQGLVILRAQGKEFTASVDNPDLKDWDIRADITKWFTEISEGRVSPEVMDEMWERSRVRLNVALLLGALTAKGFEWPKSVPGRFSRIEWN